MSLRNPNNGIQHAGLVDRYINEAYDDVRHVAGHIHDVENVSLNMDQITLYNQNVANGVAGGGDGSTVAAGYVTLESLGILPSTTLDQTTAIQDAIATYNHIWFNPGTYMVSSMIVVNGSVLQGPGTIWKGADADEAMVLLGDRIVIDGLRFASNTPTANQTSEIRLGDGVKRVVIRNCDFNGSLYSAIRADVNAGTDAELTYNNVAEMVSINNNHFEGYSRQLYLHSVRDLIVTNNVFYRSARDAVRCRQNVGKCIITGNLFRKIGTPSSIIERPKSWSSLESYAVDATVSVAPYGIYKAVTQTTIGANPATSGASEWTLLDGAYFETQDAVDNYWSGKEMVLANNIVDECEAHGFDIKGSEPSGDYSTRAVIIANNFISKCRWMGINFHSGGENLYVGNVNVTGNIIQDCNLEGYDVSNSGINFRGGTTNANITGNQIIRHRGRGMIITNSNIASIINRSFLITNNQIVNCGVPGHPSNIGMQLSPIQGALIQGNVIENSVEDIKRWKLKFTGTVSATGTLYIPSRLYRASTFSSITLGQDARTVASLVAQSMQATKFPDDYNPLLDIRYYDHRQRLLDDVQASATHDGAILFKAAPGYKPGTDGNGITVTIKSDNVVATSVNTGAVNVVGNNVEIVVRTAAKYTNIVYVFNAYANAAGADQLITAELLPTVDKNLLAQPDFSTYGTDPVTYTLTGGVDVAEIEFDTRLEKHFDQTAFPFTFNGITVELTEADQPTNAVMTQGIVADIDSEVGNVVPLGGASKVFSAGRAQMMITGNIVRNTGITVEPRYQITINGREPKEPQLFVDRTNEYNTTPYVAHGRISLAGGAEADFSFNETINNSVATLTEQGITYYARKAGSAGNLLGVAAVQQTGTFVDSQGNNIGKALSVTSAPMYVTNGQTIGGNTFMINLPTDATGAPVVATVSEVEAEMRRRVQSDFFKIEDNIIE